MGKTLIEIIVERVLNNTIGESTWNDIFNEFEVIEEDRIEFFNVMGFPKECADISIASVYKQAKERGAI